MTNQEKMKCAASRGVGQGRRLINDYVDDEVLPPDFLWCVSDRAGLRTREQWPLGPRGAFRQFLSTCTLSTSSPINMADGVLIFIPAFYLPSGP